MSTPTCDLIIVGGGITGAGIARDAALRGLKVTLLEKSDYGSGTSSKSSKLIHGGLRYLEHGEIGLVFESVSERAVQLRVAPHLVKPLAFLVPIYEGSTRGLEMVNLGLWIYDTLALFRAPRLHKTFRGAKAAELEPLIANEGLVGAIEYYDCVTDDARLVLENVIDAQEHGADCRSYSEVVSLKRDDSGRVRAVEVRDVLTGAEETLSARLVILAAGAWTDEAAKQLDIDVGRQLLRRTKGVHLVFPHEKLPLRRAVTLTSPLDGRVMFAIPWRGRTVLGTTDTDFEGSADQVDADESDAFYLCESANRCFPSVDFRPEDAISSWAGLRPLINDQGAESEGAVSREHEVFVRDDGIIIIAGGKLTTYRRMAKEVVRVAIKWLKRRDKEEFSRRKLHKPRTKKRPLPGAIGLDEPSVDGIKKLARQIAEEHEVDYETARHLTHTYGVRARMLAKMIDENDALGLRMQPDLPYVWAEVEFAVLHDLARTVDDVLSRRIPLLLVGYSRGLDVLDRVATTVGRLLDWSDEERARHIEHYRTVVAAALRFQPAALSTAIRK
ncbi:MAG: glycerol-3-phosphate dehydrogenase/oxidase [Proteobacteria bacterium]|nr:glycerol-3-phosphate dehydrogenase/oxidase [Pseudomonadota bacterium]